MTLIRKKYSYELLALTKNIFYAAAIQKDIYVFDSDGSDI